MLRSSSAFGLNTSKNAPANEYPSMLKRLLSPDPAEGTPGTPSPTPSGPPSNPMEKATSPPIEAKPAGPKPAPPITAEAVLKGTKTERELELESKLTAHERRMAELEDENRTLKTPKPTPQPKPAPEKRHWLEGGTFFE
jgi:hypothetical protein